MIIMFFVEWIEEVQVGSLAGIAIRDLLGRIFGVIDF
jgi:hypothetical protein